MGMAGVRHAHHERLPERFLDFARNDNLAPQWRAARFRANVAPMREKVYPDFDAAVADIPDGASIMLSGFAGPGTARNLIAALFRQGAKGLTLISNTPGRWQDDRVDSGVLVKEGRVARIHAAFTASPHPSVPSPFTDLYEAGKIEAELMPQGTLAERIRAAGAGIAAFYTPYRRRHRDGGGQGDARLRRQGVRDGDRAPRRLRLRPRAPRRPLRQPAVPPHAAQLRPRHGAAPRERPSSRWTSRSSKRATSTPTTSTRRACSWTASSSSRRTASRRSRPSDERTPHSPPPVHPHPSPLPSRERGSDEVPAFAGTTVPRLFLRE